MKTLRIAQIAPLIESVPPAGYGGTERVVYHLTEELVRRGHNVTLFASADSRTSAKLCPLVEKGLRLDGKQATGVFSSLVQLEKVYDGMKGKFDIIHSHVDCFTFPFARKTLTPTVLTLHGRLDTPEVARILRVYRDLNYVSISNSQRCPVPDINWVGTVYHGYPPENFEFNDTPSDYFFYLGRLSPEKAPDQAIMLARKNNVRLKIAAKIDPLEMNYFNECIKPMLDDPLVEFLGEVAEKEKVELLKNARALLNTINWPEPFGLVMIEALACGTPVIVRCCGSAREIVTHGETGYICESQNDFSRAIRDAGKISRFACRKDFEKRFSHKKMVDGYERLYYRLCGNRAPKGVATSKRHMTPAG